MILTKTVNFKLNQFNSHHFKRLGYQVEGKEELDVKIEDIGKGTMVKIKVKCDVCGNEKEIGYRKYWKNFHKYGVYSCSNKCSMFKNEKTNLEKYGVKHQCQNKEVQNNILTTKLERGLISNTIEGFMDYRRIVNNLTRKIKKEIMKSWNGFDYYDGEYIKDNFNLDSNDSLYPSIDHKISVLYGYQNGLSPEEICNKENLCLTKRRLNSSKNFKIEDIFKQKIQSN